MKKIGAVVLGPMMASMVLAGSAQAGGLPWGKEMAAGHDLPRPYGLGVDFFSMDQDYEISSLQFSLPGVPPIPPELVDVKNEIDHKDIKFDAWLFPFLNVFALYGKVDARTDVDLTAVPTAQLGLPPLGRIPIRYDGNVYGAGLTLAYGGDAWFTSLTGTWTHTNLSGDFDSSVKSQSWQPRVGLVEGPWAGWVGAQYIKVEEDHAGVIQLVPALPPIPFAVSLQESKAWTPMLGASYSLNKDFNFTAEYGGGARKTWLFNATWRFGGSN
jgi:hypothetical protein